MSCTLLRARRRDPQGVEGVEGVFAPNLGERSEFETPPPGLKKEDGRDLLAVFELGFGTTTEDSTGALDQDGADHAVTLYPFVSRTTYAEASSEREPSSWSVLQSTG